MAPSEIVIGAQYRHSSNNSIYVGVYDGKEHCLIVLGTGQRVIHPDKEGHISQEFWDGFQLWMKPDKSNKIVFAMDCAQNAWDAHIQRAEVKEAFELLQPAPLELRSVSILWMWNYMQRYGSLLV